MKQKNKLPRQVTASLCHDSHKSRGTTMPLARHSRLTTALRLLLFLTIMVIGSNRAWAETYEWSRDGHNTTLTVNVAKGEGEASDLSGYSISYGGRKYTSAVKMESATTLTFTTTKTSTITVGVALKDKITYSNAENTALSLTTGSASPVTANTGITESTTGALNENGLEVVFTNVPAGTQVIKRVSSEKGVFYIKVVESDAAAYNLSYNLLGHGDAIPNTNVSALPNPLPTPTATGYTFGGWCTASNCNTLATAGGAVNQNTTLYAKWTTTGVPARTESIFSLTASHTSAVNVPSKGDITDFSGYSVEVMGGTLTRIYNYKTGQAEMLNTNGINIAGSSASYIEITLDQNLQEGDVIHIPTTAGVYKLSSTASNSAVEYTASDGYYIVKSGDKLINNNKIFIWKEGGSIVKTVEVLREVTKFTVNFNAGTNGTCATASLTEESEGAGVTLPAVTVKDGYRFMGWSTSSTPESADAGSADATYNPTNDCTLYAYYTTLTSATVTVTGGRTYQQGDAITLTGSATPTNGGKIYGVSGINNGNAYRWKSCNSDGSNLKDISGAQKATYTPSSATPGKYYYRFMCVENVAGTAGYKTTLSEVITVIVQGTPVISASETSVNIEKDKSINITLTSPSTGAYSVSSSNTKAITASVAGNILTLTSVGGTASGVTITVNQTETDIYHAASPIYITANVVKKNMPLPVISCTDNMVTITSVPNATIYYTKDGTDPTDESTTYTNPFDIRQNTTIKAFAKASDYNDSGISTYNAQFIDNGNPISHLATITTSETYTPYKDLTGGSEGYTFDNDNKIVAYGAVTHSTHGLRVKDATCYLAIKVANGANVQIIGKRHGGKDDPTARNMWVGTTTTTHELANVEIPYNETRSICLENQPAGVIYIYADGHDLDVKKIIVTYVNTPTFVPASGGTFDVGGTITVTGPVGSTIYAVWDSNYQEAGDVKTNKTASGATPLDVTADAAGPKTLYAVAEKDGVLSLIGSATYTINPRYTVTFDSNGGTAVQSATQTTSGANIDLPATQREEHNFAGWWTAKTGGEEKTAPFAPTSDMTLYARWIKHTVYEGTTIGSPDKSQTWWSAFSQSTTLKRGITYHFSFKNYGGTDNWNNWCLVAANMNAHGKQDNENYEEYFVLRSDNYGWENNNTNNYFHPSEVGGQCTYTNWETYKSVMQAGANVEINVTYNGTAIVIDATVDRDVKNWKYTYTSDPIPENPVVYFAADQCYITDFTVTVPSYTYTVNAVSSLSNPEQHVIDIIETGETTEGLTVYFPKVLKVGDKFYTTTETPYNKTFAPATSNDDQNEYILYTEDNTIVAYTEGEAGVRAVQSDNYSKGYRGYVAAQNAKDRGIDMGTLQPGVYKLVANVIDQAERNVALRNGSTILAAITSTGVQTTQSFTITTPTAVKINGRDSGEKTNQSADFDYAYIQCDNGLVIRKDPVGMTYYQNANALPLTVDVYAYKNGFVTPSYQWYSNSTNTNSGGQTISGATNATYRPLTATAGTKYYYCVVSYDGLTSQTSQPAMIKVVDNITCTNSAHTVHDDNTVPSGAFWTNFSTSYTINTEREKRFSFDVQGGDASYNNWFMALSSAPGHSGDNKYEASFEKLILRGDGYGWSEGYNAKATQLLRVKGGNKEIMTVPANNGGFSDETFINDMKNAHVEVKVSYSGTTAYVYTKITSNTGSGNVYYLSQTTNEIPAGTLYVFFGTDGSSISNLTTTEQINAYRVTANMTKADAGLMQIINSDGIATPNGTYVGAGTNLTIKADIYSGYNLTGWSATGTQGSYSGFQYTLNNVNANTVVTATTGVSSYKFVPKTGTSPSYIITKGSTKSFPEDLLTIKDNADVTVSSNIQWSCEVVKDAAARYKGINYDASALTAVINGSRVDITSNNDADGGAVVVTALINGTDKLSYVITMPYIGNHAFDMHHMADKAEVKADGHWSLGYEVVEGAKHKDPLVQLGDKLDGNNAGIVNETNGLYITTEGTKNLGMAVTSGVTTNETNAYNISDVTGVNLLALKNATVTIPQVKRDWFIKLYLDPHAGGVHRSGAGTEFSITNVKDLEGKTIDGNDILCTNGVQWDRAGVVDLKTPDKDFRGCMIFRVAANGDVKINFMNNGWNKLVRVVVTNKFSSEMELGSIDERTVDYLRWNHNFVHRVYDDGNGEYGEGVRISYNGDPNCKAENAFLIDHEISRKEGDVECSAMADNPWTSRGGVTYWAGTTTASNGVGNIKIRSNATYQAGSGIRNSWTSGGPDKRYVLNCNETWVVVGKLKVQKYPYTWDFEAYNMNKPVEANRTMTKINNSLNATNDTTYGAWCKENNEYKTNRIESVTACRADNSNTTSPFYTINETTGIKTFDIPIYKPLFANGAQLTKGTETIPETEGLGIWVNQAYYVYGDNYQTRYDKQVTFDVNKLSVNGPSMNVTIPEVKRNEAGKPMFVFVKASAAVTATNTIAPTVGFTPYAGTEGAAVVSVFEVDTDDQTAKDVVINVPSGVSIYKIGVTDQVKDVAYYGYTTESRAIDIDHAETKSFSANMSAFYITDVSGKNRYQIETAGAVTAHRINVGEYVPAGNGVVLKDDSYTTRDTKYYIPLFVPAVNIKATAATLTGNQLLPTTTPSVATTQISGSKVNDDEQYYTMSIYFIKVDDDNNYVDDNGAHHIKEAPSFFRYIGNPANVANKAYLHFDTSNPSPAKSIDRFLIDFDILKDACDVDGDGIVDVDDVNTVVSTICGKKGVVVTDVNGDGVIDINDITTIINKICGGK